MLDWGEMASLVFCEVSWGLGGTIKLGEGSPKEYLCDSINIV